VATEGEQDWTRAGGAQGDFSPRLAALPLLLVEGEWTIAQQFAADGRWRQTTLPRRQMLGALFAWLAHAMGDGQLATELVGELLPAGPAGEPGNDILTPALLLQRVAASLAIDAGRLAVARDWIDAHGRWLGWCGAVLGQAEHECLWARYHRAAGDLAAARTHANRALAHATEPRQPLVLLQTHRLLGELATADARAREAEDHLAESQRLAKACAAPYEGALTSLATAELAMAAGRPDEARPLLDGARDTLTGLGARPALERVEAVAQRLDALDAAPSFPSGLSIREVEVLRLVAAGMTNARIGEQLFISPRTVDQHLRSIYNKLGVSSRAAATRFAVQHGVV
jgi:DNA-binding CsgD family transcriptional regulator